MADPKFKVGDVVWTRFHGRRTKHVVLDVSTTRHSHSGVTYLLSDWPVPKGEDASQQWIDEAWFT